jgi:hypothetical protein
MKRPIAQLPRDYPAVAKAIAEGLPSGRIAQGTAMHVGNYVRRFFYRRDGAIIVETGWNNAPSSFEEYS